MIPAALPTAAIMPQPHPAALASRQSLSPSQASPAKPFSPPSSRSLSLLRQRPGSRSDRAGPAIPQAYRLRIDADFLPAGSSAFRSCPSPPPPTASTPARSSRTARCETAPAISARDPPTCPAAISEIAPAATAPPVETDRSENPSNLRHKASRPSTHPPAAFPLPPACTPCASRAWPADPAW